MTYDEILEYPFQGSIVRIVAGLGDADDIELPLYDGVMDVHMVTDEEGRMMQTSSYIISIPLTNNEDGEWVVPRKGDRVMVVRYGDTISFEVDNAEPSQLGGVSIYCSRSSW